MYELAIRFNLTKAPVKLVWRSQNLKTSIYLLSHWKPSNKVSFHENNRGNGRFLKNRNFTPRMGTRSTLFRLVSLLIRSLLKSDRKYNMEWQKTRGQRTFYLYYKRSWWAWNWFLTHFRAKISPFSPFKHNNFSVAKIKGSLTPHFLLFQTVTSVKDWQWSDN